MASKHVFVRKPGEVAVWDEDPGTFEDFVYEAFMFRDELSFKNKRYATARIMRSFKDRNQAAWRLCKRLRENNVHNKVLQGCFGVEFLLQSLKRELCPHAIPDIAKHIDNYLYRFKRLPDEAMSVYIARDAEVYGRMCQALARVGKDKNCDLLESTDWITKTYERRQEEQKAERDWQTPSNWWQNSRWSQWQDRGGDEAESPRSERSWSPWRDPADGDPQPQTGWNLGETPARGSAAPSEHSQRSLLSQVESAAGEEWTGDMLSDPWWSEGIEPWQNRSSIDPLPDVLLGWLLLQRSGLERTEKLQIQSSVANTWSRATVAQALKDQWPDAELSHRDARHHRERRDKSTRRANAAFDIYSDSNDDDDPDPEGPSAAAHLERALVAIVAAEDQVMSEMEPDFAFNHEDEEEAYWYAVEEVMAVQQDARALQRRHSEARGIINDIKRNRGYYDAQKGPPKAAGRGRPPFRRWNDKGRGKYGGGGGSRFPPPPRPHSDARPVMRLPSRPNVPRSEVQKGPCLQCGKDHATRDCDDPQKPKRTVRFASAISFTAAGSTAAGSQSEMALPAVASEDEAAFPATGIGSTYEGMGLLDCGATDSLGGWPAAEAILHRSMAMFGREAVKIDTEAQKVFLFGDGKHEACLSALTAPVRPLGVPSEFSCNVANNEATPVLVSIDSMGKMGAIVNFETGAAIFQALDPESTVALYKGPGKHLWIDLFGEHPVIGDRSKIFER